MRPLLPLVVALALTGCGGDDDFACALGELHGTWRLRYQEHAPKDPTACGPVPDDTVNFDSPGGGNDGCVYKTSTISQDKCRLDIDFTCTDGGTTVHSTGVTRQTGEGTLEADITIFISSKTDGMCQSTYTITYTKL